jgi:hypothetical protein
VDFNLLKRTINSTVAPKPRIIVISNSEEEVKIIFQLVVEEQTPQVPKLEHVEEEVEL